MCVGVGVGVDGRSVSGVAFSSLYGAAGVAGGAVAVAVAAAASCASIMSVICCTVIPVAAAFANSCNI